jgi:hypothetical protein
MGNFSCLQSLEKTQNGEIISFAANGSRAIIPWYAASLGRRRNPPGRGRPN